MEENSYKIAKEYKDVALNFLFVDNAAMQIIQNPTQFDVVLTENLFGDIISDEASVICGSIGLLHQVPLEIKMLCLNPFMVRIRKQKEKTSQTLWLLFYLQRCYWNI